MGLFDKKKTTKKPATKKATPRTPKTFGIDKMVASREITVGTSLKWASQASGIKNDAKVATRIKKNGGRIRDGVIIDPGTSSAVYVKGHGYMTFAQAKSLSKSKVGGKK